MPPAGTDLRLVVSAALAAGLLAGYGIAIPVGAVGAYLGMWGMTMMNPLTIVYFTALVLGRQAAATPGRMDQAVFVVAVFVASASWQLVLAGGGAFLGRVLTGGRGRLVTGLASSILIGVLAVRLLVTAA